MLQVATSRAFHHQLQLQTITVPPQTSIDDSTHSFVLPFDGWTKDRIELNRILHATYGSFQPTCSRIQQVALHSNAPKIERRLFPFFFGENWTAITRRLSRSVPSSNQTRIDEIHTTNMPTITCSNKTKQWMPSEGSNKWILDWCNIFLQIVFSILSDRSTIHSLLCHSLLN